MISRVNKYSKNGNLSRSERNKELYDEVFQDTNYNNMVVIDDSNEIDISKIKELIDNEKKKTRSSREINSSIDIYGKLPEVNEEDTPKRVYDINEVLKEAKSKRGIIEEASEKRKIQNYNFRTTEEIENELAKTRKVYENLIKEEKELLNIMNTLTNVDASDIALDIFSDLKPTENTIVTKPISKGQTLEKTISVKQITNDDMIDEDDEQSKEYSTDTFMFDTKDFEGVRQVEKSVKKTKKFLFVLIFFITVILVCGIVFGLKYFVFK